MWKCWLYFYTTGLCLHETIQREVVVTRMSVHVQVVAFVVVVVAVVMMTIWFSLQA